MSLPEIGPCAYPTVARCLLLWAVVRLQPQMATAPAVSTATLTYEAALQERRQLYRAVFFGLTQRSTCMAARSVPRGEVSPATSRWIMTRMRSSRN